MKKIKSSFRSAADRELAKAGRKRKSPVVKPKKAKRKVGY